MSSKLKRDRANDAGQTAHKLHRTIPKSGRDLKTGTLIALLLILFAAVSAGVLWWATGNLGSIIFPSIALISGILMLAYHLYAAYNPNSNANCFRQSHVRVKARISGALSDCRILCGIVGIVVCGCSGQPVER